VSIGVWMLRRSDPHLERPFRTPGMPWVPILGALICVSQMAGLPLATWVRLVVWLAVGLAIYFGYGRRSAARMRGGLIATPRPGRPARSEV